MSVQDHFDFGLELRKAHEEGYEAGRRDAVKWNDAKRFLPGAFCFGQVLVIVNGEYNNCTFHDAYMLAEYNADDGWIIDGYEEWENPDVRWWMRLPSLPKEVER